MGAEGLRDYLILIGPELMQPETNGNGNGDDSEDADQVMEAQVFDDPGYAEGQAQADQADDPETDQGAAAGA